MDELYKSGGKFFGLMIAGTLIWNLATTYLPMKNQMGDLLGHSRCAISGKTLWHEDVTQYNGQLVSQRALEETSPEVIAMKIQETGKSEDPNKSVYSADQIPNRIADAYLNP